MIQKQTFKTILA